MPSDELPKLKHEMTQAELESLVEVKIFPGEKLSDVTEALDRTDWVNFLLTTDYDIFIGLTGHTVMSQKLGVHRNDNLIPGGHFRIQASISGFKIAFAYWGNKTDIIHAVTEKKITEFLKSKNINISKTEHF